MKIEKIYILKCDWMQGLMRDTSYSVGFALTKEEAETWKKGIDKQYYPFYEEFFRRKDGYE